MADGIDLLLADHRRVEALFRSFEESRDAAFVGQIIDALAAHDDAEHTALYPLATAVLGDDALVARSMAAHAAVKLQIDVVTSLEGEPLIAAVAELEKLVATHVADEERKLFPALTDQASPAQLQGLGARTLQTKQRVG